MENISLQNNLESGDSYFMQKRFEMIVESNHKKIKSELDDIRNTLDALNRNISEIKRFLTMGSRGTEHSVTQLSDAGTTNPPSSKNQADATSSISSRESQNQNEGKPRYGGYQPEDVPIEKFFYCGNKTK